MVGRRHPARGALVAVVGLAILWAAGPAAGRYLPAWGEAEPRCVLDGRCTPAEVDTSLSLLWAAALVGVVLVLVGVVLGTRALSRDQPEVPPKRARLAHASLAGLAAGLLAWVFAVPVLFWVFLAPQAVPGSVLTAWLVPAVVLSAVDRAFGRNSARRAWLTALALVPVATVATLAVVPLVPDAVSSIAVLGVVHGGVVAVGVALVPTGADDRSAARRAAHAVLLLAAAVAVVAAIAGVQSLGERPAVDETVVREVPDPVVPAEPAPSTSTPRPVAPVEAARPCGTADLTFAVGGFDAAMGARAASLRATNVSATPCWVEGVPAVSLLQGGRDLDLAVGPGQAPDGGGPPQQRVGLAPSGSAVALLTWRTYAGWADAETPQAVAVALDRAGLPVPAALPTDAGPAPFDLADGGEWGIAPWAPPWN